MKLSGCAKALGRIFVGLLLLTYQTVGAQELPLRLQRGINMAIPFERTTSDCKMITTEPKRCYQGISRALPPNTPSALTQNGFDFVRLPINPAPLLNASAEVRRLLLDQIEEGIRELHSQNIFVIVDLHFWSPPDPVWTEESITAPGGAAYFSKYQSLMDEIVIRLSRYDTTRIALELLNEPLGGKCDEADIGWMPLQKALLETVRHVSKTLLVVVSGCGGQLNGLLSISEMNFDFNDRNIIYSFHFYEPYAFTHQGLGGNKYVSGLRYPASSGSIAAAQSQSAELIENSGLDKQFIPRELMKAASKIHAYYRQSPDRLFIGKRLDQVIAWATKHGIQPDRLLMGEYSAQCEQAKSKPADKSDCEEWTEDVSYSADARGIPRAYWGIFDFQGFILRADGTVRSDVAKKLRMPAQ